MFPDQLNSAHSDSLSSSSSSSLSSLSLSGLPVPAPSVVSSVPASSGSSASRSTTSAARSYPGSPAPVGSSAGSDPDSLAVFRRIVPRDRALLALLAEHYLLSAPQIAAAFFDGRRTAQRRLTTLYRLGVLHRFAYANAAHTSVPYLYTLGPVGLQLYPTVYNDPDNRHTKAPRSSLDRARRIAASATAAHLLGVNQFFIDLIAAARRPSAEQPAASADGERPSQGRPPQLLRWWSEQHATDVYAQSGIRPDGHGIWQADGAAVGFFVEHDRGTENLPRVVAKLRGYARLAEFGPRYPVLLWLPTAEREANLLRLLTGVRTPMPIATAVHGPDPAGRVWTLAADLPSNPGHRYRLHELPSDHGPHSGTNPGRPADS